MATTNSSTTGKRQAYVTPTLRLYGHFTRLTASGSGTQSENNMGMGQPFRRP